MIHNMKYFVVALFALLAVAQGLDESNFRLLRHGLPPPPPRARDARTPVWDWIEQPLDNFDPSNTQTWYMRFISNDQFCKTQNCPIFIMTGAEWTIDPGYLEGGQMYDIAQQNGGWMFYTEHRYYGNSKPTSDLSTANLKYLSTPQALQDVANFITYAKQKYPKLANSKVVIVGGSYGGNMAIWMREQYPNLVHAALSSSAPVKAKVDFFEYFEVVQSSLANPNCYGVISSAVAKVKQLLASGSTGINKVKTDFRLCTAVNINDMYDTAYFYNSIANEFAGIVQYASGSAISNTCNELMNYPSPSSTAYDKLVRFIQNRRQSCVGNYQNFVSYFAQSDLPGDSRQWLFQTCNEYGYFQTSNSTKQPFGYQTFPVAMNYKMCQDIYGQQYNGQWTNQAAAATNNRYGALNPKVTRVVSVHGTIDPWHALGLTQDVNADAPVIVVPGTSHCADLSSLSSYDVPAMQQAKLREQQLIKAWLAVN